MPADDKPKPKKSIWSKIVDLLYDGIETGIFHFGQRMFKHSNLTIPEVSFRLSMVCLLIIIALPFNTVQSVSNSTSALVDSQVPSIYKTIQPVSALFDAIINVDLFEN